MLAAILKPEGLPPKQCRAQLKAYTQSLALVIICPA